MYCAVGFAYFFYFSLPWEYMQKNFLHTSSVFKTGETTVCYDLPTLAHPCPPLSHDRRSREAQNPVDVYQTCSNMHGCK